MQVVKKHIYENQINAENLSDDEILKLAYNIHLPTKEEKKKTVLKSIKRILSKSGILVEGTDIDSILFKIESDPNFKSNIK